MKTKSERNNKMSEPKSEQSNQQDKNPEHAKAQDEAIKKDIDKNEPDSNNPFERLMDAIKKSRRPEPGDIRLEMLLNNLSVAADDGLKLPTNVVAVLSKRTGRCYLLSLSEITREEYDKTNDVRDTLFNEKDN
jgi:hypothetical protein